jgi:uncharacterized protein
LSSAALNRAGGALAEVPAERFRDPRTVRCESRPCYARRVRFEWDPEKAESNLTKHGVSFDEASSVFGDPLATSVADPEHSAGEERFLTTGMSNQQRVVIVWHVDRGDVLRIIGAREVTPRERRTYESGE